MPRSLVWTLYALLVVIWSSTWVAIKIGLEDIPPLLGAGIRFGLAGLGLLLIARVMGRPLRTDPPPGRRARAAAVRGRLDAERLRDEAHGWAPQLDDDLVVLALRVRP